MTPGSPDGADSAYACRVNRGVAVVRADDADPQGIGVNVPSFKMWLS